MGGGEDTAARREVLAILAIVGACVLFVVGRPLARRLARHPTAERCVAMLDRYAEQQARAYERVPALPPAPRATDAAEVVRCTRELTDAEVECALGSGYADALERCLP